MPLAVAYTRKSALLALHLRYLLETDAAVALLNRSWSQCSARWRGARSWWRSPATSTHSPPRSPSMITSPWCASPRLAARPWPRALLHPPCSAPAVSPVVPSPPALLQINNGDVRDLDKPLSAMLHNDFWCGPLHAPSSPCSPSPPPPTHTPIHTPPPDPPSPPPTRPTHPRPHPLRAAAGARTSARRRATSRTAPSPSSPSEPRTCCGRTPWRCSPGCCPGPGAGSTSTRT
jgi:hypothetical protein